MSKCIRTICWHGKVEKIEAKEGHVYTYRGRIPCTGPRVCMYCGTFEDDVNHQEKGIRCTESRLGPE